MYNILQEGAAGKNKQNPLSGREKLNFRTTELIFFLPGLKVKPTKPGEQRKVM